MINESIEQEVPVSIYPDWDDLDPNIRSMLEDDMRRDPQRRSQAEITKDRLEYMLYRPNIASLAPTGKYGKAKVHWLPGHLWRMKRDENHADPFYTMDPRDKGFFGPKPAQTMIVLSGPLQRDVQHGRYLSGKAGEILFKAFQDHGIPVDDMYVTGSCKFYDPFPNMNSIPAAWLRAGQWHLQQEIARVNPKYILVLGAKPLKFMMGNQAKLYSYQAAFTEYHGAKMMANFDVYGIINDMDKMPGFASTMRIFCSGMSDGSTEYAGNDKDYKYVWDADTLRDIVSRSMGAKEIAIDCEWQGESPREENAKLLTIQFSTAVNESTVVVLWSNDSRRGFSPSTAVAIDILRPLFTKPGIRIIGQNFRADLEWLIAAGLDLTDSFANNGFDTMLAEHSLSEGSDHDLMALTLRYTDEGRYDYTAQLLLDRGLKHADLPDHILHPYAAYDTDVMLQIAPQQEDQMLREHREICERLGVDPVEAEASPAKCELSGKTYVPSVWNNFNFTIMPATAPIKEVEEQGMLVDKERLDFMVDAFNAKADDQLRELRQWVGDADFNPDSPKQVMDVLFGDSKKSDGRLRLGLTPVKASGKRGKPWSKAIPDKDVWWEDGIGWKSNHLSPSTDSESLAIFAEEQDCQFAGKLKDYRAISKMVKSLLAESYLDDDGEETYDKGVGACMSSDGKVRTHLSQMAETGRYKSYNTNLQNWPKGKEGIIAKIFPGVKMPSIRSIIVPDPGTIFIEADYQSAELFTLAYIANDPEFKAALATRDENGKLVSFHTIAMLKYFKDHPLVRGRTHQELTEMMDMDTLDAKILKGLRTAGKSLSFGIPYGRGARAIWQAVKQFVDCTVDDAQEWINGYYSGFVLAGNYLDWCKQQVWDPGYLDNPYGRRRHFFYVDGELGERIMAAQERESTNFPIQGTVADSLSQALSRLYHERNRRGMKTRIVLPIHDAILLQAPYDEIGEAAKLLQYAMVDAPGAVVPGIGLRFGVDIEYSNRWNTKIDPEWLYEVSGKEVDLRKKSV